MTVTAARSGDYLTALMFFCADCNPTMAKQ
jgi:hypothetical protein